MAFTFDADPLSATMNSYVTVAAADDYFTARFNSDAWLALDLPVKEALLAQATRILNLFEYGGLRRIKSQPLKWPRQLIYDNEGYAYSSQVVPLLMMQATCEQADWIFTESNRVLDDTTLGQVTDFKAGPLTLKIRARPLANVSQVAIDLIKAIGVGTLLLMPGAGAKSMTMSL